MVSIRAQQEQHARRPSREIFIFLHAVHSLLEIIFRAMFDLRVILG